MTVDPRLAERRKTVAEDKAKRNVGRLLKFLVAVVVFGSMLWLAFSPWLSVGQVETSGIDVSSGYSILAGEGVMAGTPMIQVNAAATETALLDDPWISEAHVEKDWPNGVTVTVVERSPVAWTRTQDGWTRRSLDGVALPSGPEPGDHMARIEMPELAEVVAATAPEMLGALEFVDALPRAIRSGTVVTTQDGELWATVSGYQVRLGRGVEMRQKALSLQALLEKSIPEGSVLTLIAPTNPAVMTPRAQDQTESGGQSADDRSDDTDSSDTTDTEGEKVDSQGGNNDD